MGTDMGTEGPSKLPPHTKKKHKKQNPQFYFFIEVLLTNVNKYSGQLIVIIRSCSQLALLD